MDKKYEPKEYTLKELGGKSGIYQIRNLINNKIYVGSSNNLRTRFNGHFNLLDKNKHHNPYLQKAYNKYGKNNFVYEIIEFCEVEILLQHEDFWINKLNATDNLKGYNIQPKATCLTISEKQRQSIIEANKRRIYTLEQRKKQSLLMSGSGNPMYGINKGNAPSARKIVCIEDKLAFNSIVEATEYYGLYKNGIIRCLMGIRNTCGKKHWCYYENYNEEKTQLTWV